MKDELNHSMRQWSYNKSRIEEETVRKIEANRLGSKFEERGYVPGISLKKLQGQDVSGFLPQLDSQDISTTLPNQPSFRTLDLSQVQITSEKDEVVLNEQKQRAKSSVSFIRKIHGRIINATDNNHDAISNAIILKPAEHFSVSIYNRPLSALPINVLRPSNSLIVNQQSQLHTSMTERPISGLSQQRPGSSLKKKIFEQSKRPISAIRPGSSLQWQRPGTSLSNFSLISKESWSADPSFLSATRRENLRDILETKRELSRHRINMSLQSIANGLIAPQDIDIEKFKGKILPKPGYFLLSGPNLEKQKKKGKGKMGKKKRPKSEAKSQNKLESKEEVKAEAKLQAKLEALLESKLEGKSEVKSEEKKRKTKKK